jgi:hypothetical protein
MQSENELIGLLKGTLYLMVEFPGELPGTLNVAVEDAGEPMGEAKDAVEVEDAVEDADELPGEAAVDGAGEAVISTLSAAITARALTPRASGVGETTVTPTRLHGAALSTSPASARTGGTAVCQVMRLVRGPPRRLPQIPHPAQ